MVCQSGFYVFFSLFKSSLSLHIPLDYFHNCTFTTLLHTVTNQLLPATTNLLTLHILLSAHLQALKEQDQYNKEKYRLSTLSQELDIQKSDQAILQSKEMELVVRQESLLARVSISVCV